MKQQNELLERLQEAESERDHYKKESEYYKNKYEHEKMKNVPHVILDGDIFPEISPDLDFCAASPQLN